LLAGESAVVGANGQLVSGYWMRDTGCSILDARYSMLDAGFSILDARYSIFDAGSCGCGKNQKLKLLDSLPAGEFKSSHREKERI